MKQMKIRLELLDFVLRAAKSTHPNEMAGVLRQKAGVIEEILFLPGTVSSEQSALLRLHMLPIDPSVCGTVHSHPSPDPTASDEDFFLFDRFGKVHVIVAYPYNKKSWRAYDHRGEEIELETIE